MLNGNAYFTIIPYETEEEIYPSVDKIFNRDRWQIYVSSLYKEVRPRLVSLLCCFASKAIIDKLCFCQKSRSVVSVFCQQI